MDIDMNSSMTVDSLLNTYPSLKRLPDKDRIKCSWTQHEMPARVDAIEKYIQGKKYQQILKKKFDYDTLEKFKDFIEPSTKKNHERQLFCKLTSRHLNKDPHHIMKHVEGKKFKRAYAQCRMSSEWNGICFGWTPKEETRKNDDDDLSDLYPDFRRLRASDLKERTTTNENMVDNMSGTKRKAQTSQVKKPKKLAAPSSKRMRTSDEKMSNGDELVKPTKTMTITI
ncbi:unnamed protein product [Adineta ricciae]|uniref:Uncharacterized protein n=1 Tax=Adineta ricciae TaxID=249248 RepID=A0A814ARY0_ADIRI|nr:unnamed protein product [Adineta ricciae]